MKFPATVTHSKLFSAAAIGSIAAILAAVTEALYIVLTKISSTDIGVLMSVAFIFFGAGCGSLIMLFFGRKSKAIFDPERHLQKKDTGKLIAIILLSMLALSLMISGFHQESATTSSILQNVTTVATVLFAAFLLKEKISKRLGIGVALIVLGSLALVVTNPATLSFSTGSLFIIGGGIIFGGIYILMKLLADRNPIETILIRSFGIGIIALIIATCMGESLPSIPNALGLMVAGFIGCGFSPMILMYAQRHLGAAKAGAIYGIYPLLGVVFAIPILGEIPSAAFLAALILFIPGMYFVITKSNNAAAAKEEETDDPNEGDAELFTSINETRKHEIRNHVTSFGLLVVALFFVMMALPLFDLGATNATIDPLLTYIPGVLFGMFTLLCGVILLILGKRVLAAVTFILMVPQMFATNILGDVEPLHVFSGIFAIIFALVLLTSKDPQKYAFSLINLLFGVASISYIFNNTFCGIIMIAAAAYLIWLSVASGTGKLRFSISKYLTKDGDMTFRRCGSVIGYLLLAIILIITLIYEYSDPSFSTYSNSIFVLGIIVAGLLLLVGLLLLFIGKRRVTSILFIGCSLALPLDMILSGVFDYLPAMLLLVLGVQNVMRGDPRILPSLLLIGNGFALILYNQLTAFPEVQTAMLLITGLCALIALYLAFAVFAEKPKLPLF